MAAADTIICARCGAVTERRGTHQRYCLECSIVANRESGRRSKRKRQQLNRKTVICPYCGLEFVQTHGSQKYCSDICAYEAKKERTLDRYWDQQPERKPEHVKKTRKRKLTLQQVAALAKAAGMTYGQYVANMEQEK